MYADAHREFICVHPIYLWFDIPNFDCNTHQKLRERSVSAGDTKSSMKLDFPGKSNNLIFLFFEL
jgi:hypothetical protein